MSGIWPTLGKILQKTNKVDDFLVDFSMELARDGAWKFAQTIAGTPEKSIENLIKERDGKVAKKAGLIVNPGFLAKLMFKIIRLGETGTIKDRIGQLAN